MEFSTLPFCQEACGSQKKVDTPINLQPQLAGRKTVFENRRIRDVFEDRRKQFDAPDDEDRGFERYPCD